LPSGYFRVKVKWVLYRPVLIIEPATKKIGAIAMRLENKVAVISGGARGMGAVEAMLFAKEGAKVVIGDMLEDEGRKTEAEINEAGGECVFVSLDVSDESAWEKAVGEAVSRFGKLDILVNNAGIYRAHNVEETSSEEWDQIMDINAKGVFLGTKYAIPAMRKASGGSIVNISSVAGLVGSRETSAYNASKGAVRLLTKSTAIQYASEGIRANSVHPGTIETPMTEGFLADETKRADRLNRTPLKRLGRPEDVAYGALYLASDESSFVTGSELVIDGGRTAE
jgi:cyclopentanol dehydrogenase